MKKYYSLGELLTDFRQLNSQTQSDLAAALSVDVRTVSRWEKNESLISPDKLAEVVEQTFIPYQVVHNLNTPVPLPVYYDFRIRKYSLSAIEQGLPDPKWFRARRAIVSDRVRTISTEEEIDKITKYHNFLYPTENPVNKLLIRQAVKLLPDLNNVVFDTAGFYAGHQVIFPLSRTAFQKVRNREMAPGTLRETDLVNYKTTNPALFYGYSVYADCNENFYSLLAKAIRFMEQEFQNDNYVYAGLVIRNDVLKLGEQVGLKKIWEDHEEKVKLGLTSPPTFLEGRFKHIVSGHRTSSASRE